MKLSSPSLKASRHQKILGQIRFTEFMYRCGITQHMCNAVFITLSAATASVALIELKNYEIEPHLKLTKVSNIGPLLHSCNLEERTSIQKIYFVILILKIKRNSYK